MPSFIFPKIHYTRFPRNFPVNGGVANLLRTCCGETGVMDFGLFQDVFQTVDCKSVRSVRLL